MAPWYRDIRIYELARKGALIVCTLTLACTADTLYAQEQQTDPPPDANQSETQNLNTATPGIETEVGTQDAVGIDIDGIEPIGLDSSASLTVSSNKWLNSYGDRLRPPEPQQNSGAFTYEVQIVTPPGRNGIEPDLQLSYNSQNLDGENHFGLGWTLNIPFIERMNKSGTEDLYTSTYFRSTFDGELASTTSGAYGARFDTGDFRIYEFSTSTHTWIVTDKNGMKYSFGSGSNARLSNPSDSTQVYRWMLEEMRDTNDNFMRYEYTKDGGQVYPSRIVYTGHGTSDGPFEVTFVTESRSDTVTSYAYGFGVTTNLRVKEVQTKLNGNVVRKYVLAYGTGHNAVKSVLASVTETGYTDSGSSISLPSTSLNYQSWAPSWTTVSGSSLPDIVDSTGADTGFRFFNYDNDSATDALMLRVGTNPYGYENVGSGWSAISVDSTAPAVVNAVGADRGAALADVNADGLMDIVLGRENAFLDVYVRSGSGFASASSTMTNIPYLVDGNGNDLGIRFGDFNGDGYPDYVRGREGLTFYVYLNKADGTGWANPVQPANAPEWFVRSDGSDSGARVADLNGDGLDDIIRHDGNPNYIVQLNKGAGADWTQSTLSASGTYAPPQITGSSGEDIGTRTADVNADGLIDFIVGDPNRSGSFSDVYFNRGDGTTWVKHSGLWNIPHFVDSFGNDLGVRLMYANKDGIPDFARSSPGVKENRYSGGLPADRLTTITLPGNGQISVTYKGVDADTVLFRVVDTITKNAQYSQPVITESFDYEQGSFQHDYQNRKFRGFGITRKKDSDNNQTVSFFHQGNGSNSIPESPYTSSAAGEYQDVEAKMYQPYRIEWRPSVGSFDTAVQINRWDTKDLGNGRSLVYTRDLVESEYNGNTTHRDSAVSIDRATSTGNLIQRIEWGEVTAADDGTFTDIETDKRTTNYTYAAGSSRGVTGLVSDETKLNNAGTKVLQTRTYYDGLSLGSVDKGNLTQQEYWKFGSSYNTVQNTYTQYGLVATSTDARGKSTHYRYGVHNLYPATTTYPLNQKEEAYYDYSSGKPKKIIDRNGFQFETTFDGFDRPLEERQPSASSPSVLEIRTTYSYWDTGTRRDSTVSYLDGGITNEVLNYYDGLGRLIQTRRQSENSYAVTDRIYNALDLLQKESLPYFSSGSSWTNATTDNTLYTQYAYDSLGRVTSQTDALGVTFSSYDDWMTTVTDPMGSQKKYYRDPFDNLVRVDEVDGSNTYTTLYEWNPNDKLTKITDAEGNVRTITYNGVGWRIDVDDLHAPSDSAYGLWHYAYNTNGQVASVTDPKGQVINYGYDDLGRVSSENFNGASGVEVTYTYDACANGVGLLCAVASASATTTYAYDPLGRISEEHRLISGTSTIYTTRYEYDRQGNPMLLTYPDNSRVSYTYNAGNLLESMSRREPAGSTFVPIIANFNYAPTGDYLKIIYNNGDEENFTYDAIKKYRLNQKRTTNTAAIKLQELTYTYDQVNNITKIEDTSQTGTAKTVDYTYDNLYRLTSASSSNAATAPNYSITYAYTPLGNIASSSILGSYLYAGTAAGNYANPHAPTAIGTTTYGYDANGNLISTSAGFAQSWDYLNRLIQTLKGNATTTYAYDYAGNRVSLTTGGATTFFPNDYFNATGTTSIRQYYANGKLVATMRVLTTGPQMFYLHDDHLGSPTITTNTSGGIVETADYYPFGTLKFDTPTGTFKEPRKFLGEEYDPSTGFSYLNARYYDGERGQFLSQDPTFLSIGDEEMLSRITGLDQSVILSDPQLANSYSYARGNPVVYTDPEGNIAFVPVLLGVFAVYGTANTAVNLMNLATVYGYSNQFSPHEKATAATQIGLDLVFRGVASAIPNPAKRVGFESLTASNDAVDQFLGERAYKNVSPRLSTSVQGQRAEVQSSMRNSPPILQDVASTPQSNALGVRDAILNNIQSLLRNISYVLSTWPNTPD